jgi:hypothetical protein
LKKSQPFYKYYGFLNILRQKKPVKPEKDRKNRGLMRYSCFCGIIDLNDAYSLLNPEI